MPQFDYSKTDEADKWWKDPSTGQWKPKDYSVPGSYNQPDRAQAAFDAQQKEAYDRAQGLLGRQAPRWATNEDAFNYGNAARQNQLEAMNLQRAQALGQGPSAANAQQQMVSDQIANQALRQAQMGHSPGAMGAGNQALGQSAGQYGQARGQEVLGGMQGYAQGAAGMRGGDLNQLGAMNKALQMQRQQGLQQSRQNLGAYKGYEDLAQEYALAKQQEAWNDYRRAIGLGQAKDSQMAQDLGTAAQVAGSTLAMFSDRRLKTDERKL